MSGGGKTATSTQGVSIPPEVLARYNSVNQTAQNVAQTPFQQYSTDPNAFVAGVNQQQQTGIQNVNQAATQGQGYFNAAAGLTSMASPTNVGPVNNQQISQYMNPYIQSVVNPTAQLLNQQQQAQMSGQTGQAIQQGAFGGDRAGLAAANLAGQQSLAFSNAINPLYSQGYNTALQTAQQQQGVNLGQQQANNQLLLQQGAQFGNLGTGAQGAALQGAQAQIGAGTLEQQTQQAGLSALYNQFLQQQAYPFQTAQFLANIAEGTGALSGSTTTTTQPSSFFSDERLKEDIEDIGRTHDGQKIVKFRYKGDKGPKQIGLIAQDVEKHHPDAVGLAGGYKTVDYDRATQDSASMGGAVTPEHLGEGFADGGAPSYLNIYGMPGGGHSSIPQQVLQQQAPRGLMLPQGGLKPQQTGMSQVTDAVNAEQKLSGVAGDASKAWGGLQGAYDKYMAPSSMPGDDNKYAHGGLVGYAGGGMPYSGEGLDIPDEENKQKLATAGSLPGQQPGIGSQIMGGIGAAKTLAGLPGSISSAASGISGAASGISGAASGLAGGIGEAASGIGGALAGAGSSIADALPLLLLAHGGSVPREHHADGDTVGNADGSIPDTTDDDYLAAVRDLIGRAGTNMARGWNDAGGIAQNAIHPAEADGPPAPTSREIEAMQRAKYTGPDAARVAPGMSLVMPPSDAALASAGLSPPSAPTSVSTPAPAQPELASATVSSPAEESVAQPANAPLPPRRPAGLSPLPASIDVRGNAAAPSDSIWNNIIRQESGGRQFNTDGSPLTSSAGAVGIAQVMPGTGPEAAKLAGEEWDPNRLATDPEYNARLGRAYFDAQMAKYKDPTLAAAAYNAGPGAVDAAIAKAGKTGGSPLAYLPAETRNYVANVTGSSSGLAAGTRAPNNQLAMNDTGTASDAGFLGGLGGAGKTISDIGGSVADAAKGTGDWFSSNQNWLVPLLKGVGTMASSPSRYFGAALLQGIGGGASAYGQQQMQQADIAQKTLGIAANRFVPIGSNQFYDKVIGDTVPVQEYRSRLAQIPGMQNYLGASSTVPAVAPTTTPAISTTPASTAVSAPTPATGTSSVIPAPTLAPTAGAPTGSTTAPTAAPTFSDVLRSKTEDIYTQIDQRPDVASLKSQYNSLLSQAKQYLDASTDPANIATGKAQTYLAQGNAARANAGAMYSNYQKAREQYAAPQIANLNATATGRAGLEQETSRKLLEEQNESAKAAYATKFRLEEMDNQFTKLPEKGILSPGAYGTERAQFAKNANAIVTALGGKPLYSPDQVAAAETLGKDTARLGFEVSKAMGGNEPGFIVQRAISANPGIDNTAMGYRRIAAGLKQAAQYEQDRSDFYNQLYQKNSNLNGAEEAFRTAHPVEAYARNAVVSTIPPDYIDRLRSLKDDENARSAFDKRFGVGASKIVLGAQ